MPNTLETLSPFFLTKHLRGRLPLNRWETRSEKEANLPRSHSWQARNMKSGLLTTSLKFPPSYHVSRAAWWEDHELPTKLKFLILIWVQAHMVYYYYYYYYFLSLSTWAYCLRAKILPTSSKCFFSSSPQLELGILQPRYHKSVEPLCSCWPLKKSWKGYFQWSICLR